VVIPSRPQSAVHHPQTSPSVESAAEAVIAEPSSEPVEPSTVLPSVVPSEPLLPSTLAQAESFSSSSSDYQQLVPSRRSRPRNTPPTSRLASPLALRRRITRSRSRHIRRTPQPISPSAEIISV
jgi:hypothetical protein